MKNIVFDLGGTLFEFVGMPYIWTDYYEVGLRNIDKKYKLNCSADDIMSAKQILEFYNPRINYREKEVAPEIIFQEATYNWKNKPNLNNIINSFFEGLKLHVHLYDDVLSSLSFIKQRNDRIAFFTDLPSGMPDGIMKEQIKEIKPFADVYMSSQKCGYRKPNPKGLKCISNILAVSVEELIFIGDEKKDCETANRANCKFILINRKDTKNSFCNLKKILDAIY